MQQMILPSTPITPENHHNFMEQGSFDTFKQNNGIENDLIPGNRIYMTKGMCKGLAVSHTDLKMVGPEESYKIKTMIDTYGEDVTMALADLFSHSDTSPSNLFSIAGGVQGYAATKSDLLVDKMNELSKLMEEHNKKLKKNIDIYSIRSREMEIEKKANNLKNRFHSELKVLITKRKQLKRSHFLNAKRAKDMAKSSRNTSQFFIENRNDFKKLVNLTRYLKILGIGFIVIDIGFRIVSGATDLWNAKTHEQSIKAGRDLTGSLVEGGTAAVISYYGFTALGALAAGVAIGGLALVFTLAVGAAITVVAASYLSKKAGHKSESLYDKLVQFFEDTKPDNKIDAFTHG